jgi:hypothetical protein
MIFATAVAEMLQVALTATPVDRGARIEPRATTAEFPSLSFAHSFPRPAFVDAGLDGGQAELPNRSTPVLGPSIEHAAVLSTAVDRSKSRRYGPRAMVATSRLLGRSQVVRQRILIPPFPGSSPGAPARNSLN